MSKVQLNLLRMLIVLTMVAMMVYSNRGLEFASPPYYLALAYLLFNLLCFLFLPRSIYLGTIFHYLLIIIDIVVVTTAMYLTSGFESDFYLIYFLVIFISSVGGDVRSCFYTALIAAVLYAWIYSRGRFDMSLLQSRFLVRIPFFLVFAFYTSFWAERVRRANEEKRLLEKFNLRLKEQVDLAIQKLADVSRFSESLTRSIRSGIIAIDNEKRIVLFNPYAREVLKFEGNPINRFIDELDPLAPIAMILKQTLNEHIELRREVVEIVVGSEPKKLGLASALLRDHNNKITGSMVLFTDLTEVFKLQERLKRSEHLAHIGEMASWVAHEIRNPLSTIQGFSELLARQDDPKKRREYLSKIKEGTKRIDNIITDILYLAKDRPKTLEPVSLNQVLVVVAEDVKALKGFDVKLNPPSELVVIHGHRDRLTRVFENLIINSIEAEAKTIEVDLGTEEMDALVTIRDDGVGMTEEEKRLAFTPFHTTKEKGTGLGLAIVEKIIVEDHRGRIECDSKKGEGTTFRIYLPLEGGQSG
ncbi:hypothetical protein DRP53_03685 [candidate division WOR-3 bacterium]|uniref:histidine kinase n=1 Tax=candidate division WOR-3 bacterium TaxID=2052148 RepID=A0A660SJE1_UNCW3|nr:MAG: hypothetical protein DRP53_03685 [candidate division WOR-3 bacterium]